MIEKLTELKQKATMATISSAVRSWGNACAIGYSNPKLGYRSAFMSMTRKKRIVYCIYLADSNRGLVAVHAAYSEDRKMALMSCEELNLKTQTKDLTRKEIKQLTSQVNKQNI